MKSVKFLRENPENEYLISSGKCRIQKIREIRSSQFIADCSRVRVNLHCASTTSTELCAIFRVAFVRKICVFVIYVVALHYMYNPTCVNNCKMTK